MNEGQSEFARLVELNMLQAKSLLEDSKRQMEDVNKRLLAAQTLKLLIDKFAEKTNRKRQCESKKGTIDFTALEMSDYLMEHRN